MTEKTSRKDIVFDELTRLYFKDRRGFAKIKKKLPALLKKDRSGEALAFAGYVAYLSEDFKRATGYFLLAIASDPDNLDNWMDLAFSLRHRGEQKMSRAILFHFDLAMHYYRRFQLPPGDFSRMKKMLEMIDAYAR